MDEVVHHDGDYIIIKSERAFGAGFNVYRLHDDGNLDGDPLERATATKISPHNCWFKSLEGARNWLDNFWKLSENH